MKLFEHHRVIHMGILGIPVLPPFFQAELVIEMEARRVLYFDGERASLGRGESAA